RQRGLAYLGFVCRWTSRVPRRVEQSPKELNRPSLLIVVDLRLSRLHCALKHIGQFVTSEWLWQRGLKTVSQEFGQRRFIGITTANDRSNIWIDIAESLNRGHASHSATDCCIQDYRLKLFATPHRLL